MSYFDSNLQPKSKEHPLAGLLGIRLAGFTGGLNEPVQGDPNREYPLPNDGNPSDYGAGISQEEAQRYSHRSSSYERWPDQYKDQSLTVSEQNCFGEDWGE